MRERNGSVAVQDASRQADKQAAAAWNRRRRTGQQADRYRMQGTRVRGIFDGVGAH
jgi:hypothetical protein